MLRIRIPKRKHHRRLRIAGARAPHYISAATQSMTIALTGPTHLEESVGLTPASTGCSSTLGSTFCTLTIPGLAPGAYTGSISMYDGPVVSDSATGNELSANQNVSFSIVAGTANSIGIAIDGIPTSVLLLPDASVLSGNMAGGYSLSRCTSAVQRVTVVGVDADGNYILGPGAPIPSLASDNPSRLAVATPAPSAPNRFGLTPPMPLNTLPTPNQKIHLTASVTPPGDSGGSVQQAVVSVTFTGGTSQVCGVITEYSISTSNSQPMGITGGPDGNLWFTEQNANNIGKITPAGTITEYSVPTGGSQPTAITSGPDGNLWFTECDANNMGKITTAGAITEYPLSRQGAGAAVTAGPDGNVWITEFGKIGKITTAGVLSEYSFPYRTANQFQRGLTGGIVTGPDGNLWFTECENDEIGSLTTAGVVTAYQLPAYTDGGYANAKGITVGPDGNLWFTEYDANKIGKITTAGAVTEYAVPTQAGDPNGITLGPDGNLWFTEQVSNKIGKITTDGVVTEYAIPTSGSWPTGITLGPDDKLWFTEQCTNTIANIQ